MKEMNEHEAFARLVDGLKSAQSGADQLAKLRNDGNWAAISGLFEELLDKCYRLIDARIKN